MRSPDEIEAALRRASRDTSELSADERAAIREVLQWWTTWKAWGRLGKIVLWVIVTIGALAAAAREIRGGPWFGG